MSNPPTFVLVHGAWHGAWCWSRVIPHLTGAGAQVFAPTLTGLGDRAHLTDPPPSLETHIQDVVSAIEAEELSEVLLVGHSYAGMVVTAVADRLEGRIRRLVYLDAAVPQDGEDFASQVPGIDAATAEARRAAYRSLSPDGVWLPPAPPQVVGVTAEADVAWLQRRLTPHPLQTWLTPVDLSGGGLEGLAKTYVMANDPPTTNMGYPLHWERAAAGGDWTSHQIETGHDMMVTAPDAVAKILLQAAGLSHD